MDTVHECDRQTDRQTDGRTDRITITDTVQTASHGNQSIFGEDMDKSMVACFFDSQCNVRSVIDPSAI